MSFPITLNIFPIYSLLCCLLEVVDDLLRDVDEAATALEPGPPPRTPGDITEVEEGGGNWWHLAAPRPSWFASIRRAVRSLSSSDPPLLPIKEYLQIKNAFKVLFDRKITCVQNIHSLWYRLPKIQLISLSSTFLDLATAKLKPFCSYLQTFHGAWDCYFNIKT